jgi:opacity protein-like surface antigen
MKRILLIAALLVASLTAATAQTGNGYKNAIGIRGAYGAEVSYQRYIAPANRLEGTLGINRYGFSAEVLHQWMFEIPANSPGVWQWYAGAGAGFGAWSNKDFKSGFSLGVQGQIGIEYSFAKAPLVMSIDYRPGVYLIPESVVDWTGLALGIRYCF